MTPPLVEAAHPLHQQALRRGRDDVLATHAAELHLELAVVPGEQAVDRVLAHQVAGLGVDHLAVAKVDGGAAAGGALEVDHAGLAADLDGLDEVDHAHVGDVAGKARAAVALSLDPLALGALEQQADPRRDLFDVDRLGQVVGDAELEPADLVFDRGLPGQEDERDLGPLRAQLERLAEREAVHVVHLGVRDDEVRLGSLYLVQGVTAVGRRRDVVACLLERDLEDAQATDIAVDE